MLNRAVTLATESANGTVGNTDRTALNEEYQSIQAEIDRIGSNTNYNGTAVFSNTPTSIYISDGTGITTQASNFISVSTGTLSSTNLLQASGSSATLAASDLIQNGDTVQIGGVTYTFVTAGANNSAPGGVTDGSATATAVKVKIDSSTDPNTAIQNTLQNLAAAVNGGSGAGTVYEGGAANLAGNANPDATAMASGNTVTFSATSAGLALASIASVATPTANELAFETGAGAAGTFAAGSGGTDLNTAADAQTALASINSAIQTIAALRGTIGASINRLQSASNVINNQVTNLTSAENTITAADIPTAVASMTKYSILEQTGISALAQANQQQQLVLKLLQ
jgi:flagellin